MPPKRRNTRQKAATKFSPEDQLKRDQCDLLLQDFDENCESIIREASRDKDAMISQILTFYKLEMMKIPTDVRNSNWSEFYQKSIVQEENILNVSTAVSSCLDDSVCTKVDQQVSQLKSAMKTARKRGTRKENEPGSAVRASSRKRNPSADRDYETLTRTSSRSRTRGLADSTNLQTPANTGRRGRTVAVPETPANSLPPQLMGLTPMITPKFDPSKLSGTVGRTARKQEVLLSLSGSPVVPYNGMRSRAAKDFAQSHQTLQLGNGQDAVSLNLPVGADVDQMKEFVQQMQNCVAMMEKAKEQ